MADGVGRHRLPKRRGPRSGKALPAPSAAEQSWTGYFYGVGIGSRKGKGPTKWEGPPGTICHGAIMDRLFLRRRHRLPKRRDPRSGKALPAPSVTEQSWTGYFSGVGIGSRKEGPDGDKWSKTTQETLGGSGGSEANGVLRNPYHPPGVTIYIEKNIYIYGKETD